MRYDVAELLGELKLPLVTGRLGSGRSASGHNPVFSIPVSGQWRDTAWRCLAGEFDQTGLWPFLSNGPPGDPFPYTVSQAQTEWGWFSTEEVTGHRSGGAVPVEETDSHYVAASLQNYEPSTGLGLKRWSATATWLNLAPVTDSFEVLAYIGWAGAGLAESERLLESWQRRFGASLLFCGEDSLELDVASPPVDAMETARVAIEQYLYCPDLVQFGLDDPVAIAKRQVWSPKWSFWWD